MPVTLMAQRQHHLRRLGGLLRQATAQGVFLREVFVVAPQQPAINTLTLATQMDQHHAQVLLHILVLRLEIPLEVYSHLVALAHVHLVPPFATNILILLIQARQRQRQVSHPDFYRRQGTAQEVYLL